MGKFPCNHSKQTLCSTGTQADTARGETIRRCSMRLCMQMCYVNSKALTKCKHSVLRLCWCSHVWDIYCLVTHLTLPAFLFCCHYFHSHLYSFSIWSPQIPNPVQTNVYWGPHASSTSHCSYSFSPTIPLLIVLEKGRLSCFSLN